MRLKNENTALFVGEIVTILIGFVIGFKVSSSNIVVTLMDILITIIIFILSMTYSTVSLARSMTESKKISYLRALRSYSKNPGGTKSFYKLQTTRNEFEKTKELFKEIAEKETPFWMRLFSTVALVVMLYAIGIAFGNLCYISRSIKSTIPLVANNIIVLSLIILVVVVVRKTKIDRVIIHYAEKLLEDSINDIRR